MSFSGQPQFVIPKPSIQPSGGTVTNNLVSSSVALESYNPTTTVNISKKGSYAQAFNISKSIREIDINSFMYYFFITIFLLLMIVFLSKGE